MPPPNVAPDWLEISEAERYRRLWIYQRNREAYGMRPPDQPPGWHERQEFAVPWFEMPLAVHPLDMDEEEAINIERKYAAVVDAMEDMTINGLQSEYGPWEG